MVEPLRHRQTKGAETDMLSLTSPRHISTHMGTFGSSGLDSVAHVQTPALFRYPRSEPDCAIWSFPGQIKLTFGRRSRRPHQYPACGGRGSGGRHHSLPRLFRPCRGSVRPPGSARTDQVLEDLKIVERLSSGAFHYGSLDNDAGGDIFPQRDQQLTRQRYDGRLFEAAAIAADPLFEPQSQRRLRLVAQP
jgi:hypothetical protein